MLSFCFFLIYKLESLNNCFFLLFYETFHDVFLFKKTVLFCVIDAIIMPKSEERKNYVKLLLFLRYKLETCYTYALCYSMKHFMTFFSKNLIIFEF